jgi:hypothetical protein
MYPKEFIENVLINEMRDIVERHAFMSFLLISVGIEFLGKCLLTEHHNWHDIKPETAFNKGKELMATINPEYGNIDLKNLRNGFTHTFLPKNQISLSERKHGAIHFSKTIHGGVILVAEDFYFSSTLVKTMPFRARIYFSSTLVKTMPFRARIYLLLSFCIFGR